MFRCITAVVLSLHVASVCHTFWSHELAVQAQIVSQLMASKVAVLVTTHYHCATRAYFEAAV